MEQKEGYKMDIILIKVDLMLIGMLVVISIDNYFDKKTRLSVSMIIFTVLFAITKLLR